MAIRIENQYEGSLPKGSLEQIENAFDSLPREHTRGIERIRLVPFITDPRIKGPFQATELPGLYHPRQGPKGAWLEIAVNVLLPADKPFHKRIIPRLSFKSNLVALVFSLVGQHYHLYAETLFKEDSTRAGCADVHGEAVEGLEREEAQLQGETIQTACNRRLSVGRSRCRSALLLRRRKA